MLYSERAPMHAQVKKMSGIYILYVVEVLCRQGNTHCPKARKTNAQTNRSCKSAAGFLLLEIVEPLY